MNKFKKTDKLWIIEANFQVKLGESTKEVRGNNGLQSIILDWILISCEPHTLSASHRQAGTANLITN